MEVGRFNPFPTASRYSDLNTSFILVPLMQPAAKVFDSNQSSLRRITIFIGRFLVLYFIVAMLKERERNSASFGGHFEIHGEPMSALLPLYLNPYETLQTASFPVHLIFEDCLEFLTSYVDTVRPSVSPNEGQEAEQFSSSSLFLPLAG